MAHGLVAERSDVVPAAVPAAPRPAGGLRLVRPASAATALGLAVSHLMTKPAFASLTFGAWSRILVGQINRGHYQLVLDGAGRVVGFLGWALTSEANAEAWVRGRGGFSDAEAREGDCVVFNAWSADTPAVHGVARQAARAAILGRRLVYFKRHYRDGRTRPTRLTVNAFVEPHLGRGAG
jgi:hemolysin-activating ACP:hemolysin acyltransferase